MRYPLLFLIVLIQFSCKKDIVESGSQIIDIDLDNLTYESLPELEIKSIIPLETNETSLVGYVNRMEYHDGKVYILDIHKSRALFAFSEDGAFLGKTKKGRGPGEMINPFDMYIDKASSFIYIWDQGLLSILKYNSNLEYLDQEAFKNPLSNFAILPDGRKLVNTHFHKDFMYKIYGADNETVEREFIPDMKYPHGLGIGRSISVSKRILTIAPYLYDIFELKSNNLDSRYQVNFGKYMLSKEDVEQNDLYKPYELTSQGQRVSSLKDISEGESFMSFKVYFKKETLNFAYSLKDQKPYLINEYFYQNLLPVCSVHGLTKDGLFYALIKPADLDDFQKASGKILIDKPIDEESNPYLITFTLGEEGQ